MDTTYRLIKTITEDEQKYEILEISSDNPGVDGYLTVSGPTDFETHWGLFSDEDEALEAIKTDIKEKNNLKWIRTDDNQIVKIHSENRYEFLELLSLNDEVYAVNHDIIDYDDYTVEDILKYIESYGYESIEHVTEMYSQEDAKQIICECIFESSEDTRYHRALSEDECISVINEDFKIDWKKIVSLVEEQMIFTVKAIRKWKNDYIIIVESETGELLLAVEDKIDTQVKGNELVIGNMVDSIVHINALKRV